MVASAAAQREGGVLLSIGPRVSATSRQTTSVGYAVVAPCRLGGPEGAASSPEVRLNAKREALPRERCRREASVRARAAPTSVRGAMGRPRLLRQEGGVMDHCSCSF